MSGPWRLGIELLILGGAAAALYAASQHALAVVFAAVVVIGGLGAPVRHQVRRKDSGRALTAYGPPAWGRH